MLNDKKKVGKQMFFIGFKKLYILFINIKTHKYIIFVAYVIVIIYYLLVKINNYLGKETIIKKIKNKIEELNKNDNASKTSAGFIYQDLVFIKKLLYLEDDGTKITHELFDDIAVIKENQLELVQVKHSINEDNLTDRSSDLWKTLSKWSKIILRGVNDRIEFVFYTNKSPSSRSNKLLTELISNNKNYINIQTLINTLYSDLEEKEKEKKTTESENPIFKYVNDIYSLSKEEQESLFSKLSLVLSENIIIEDIKKRIRYFGIEKDSEIDSIYNELLGIVTTERFRLAKEGNEFIVDFNYFRKKLKFDLLIGLARVEDIDFDKYYGFENEYNEDYTENIFYKQLKDIDIEDSKINNYAKERAKTSIFMKELELLPSQIEVISKKICDEWKIIHEDEYDEKYSDECHHKEKARVCFKETKKANILYQKQNLPRGLVEGKVVDLSNNPSIGWRLDWKDKYIE